MGKIVTLFYGETLQVHMYKDVFLAGYYIAKELNKTFEFWSSFNDNLNSHARGCKLVEVEYANNFEKYYELIKKDGKNIDVLILFHFPFEYTKLAYLYKKANPLGKLIIKLDYDPLQHQNIQYKQKNILKYYVKKILFNYLIKQINYFLVETETGYNHILTNKFFKKDISQNLIKMPNGYDNEKSDCIERLTYDQKENFIISVGRIGSEQKNNEMLLSAVENMELKDWKIVFIGHFTPEFKCLVDKSEKKKDILLLGEILDRVELFDWYNRAKVFCLTSRYEGFALVLPEAIGFFDYIISTDVGGVKDITQNGELGSIVDNIEELKKAIENVISSNIIEKSFIQRSKLAENFRWENVVKSLTVKLKQE